MFDPRGNNSSCDKCLKHSRENIGKTEESFPVGPYRYNLCLEHLGRLFWPGTAYAEVQV